jgi:membrane associated rhomboid family serine protease
MNRGGGSGMSLALPPFTGVVKKLLIINTAVFLVMLLIGRFSPDGYDQIMMLGALVPSYVLHGALWQVVTYSFIHLGLFHLLFNMLALWMFGSQFEMDWGARRFLEFYFFCVIGAAISTMVVGYAALLVSGGPGSFGFFADIAHIIHTPTAGASGGIYGLLIAFGILYGDRQIYMFPLPFAIKARYMVGIWIFIALVGALQGPGGVANFAHLGGAFCGWLYLRFVSRNAPRSGVQVKASEGFYGIRNSYYRWKRRRAASKFEVYMRKQDRSQYFDEHGNFKEPRKDDKDNSGGPRSPWVN